MTTTVHTDSAVIVGRYSKSQVADLGDKVSRIGEHALRGTTATVLAWIGAMKFTAYEAGAIQGLVQSSPLISWIYNVLSVQGASNLIGTVEIAIAALLLIGVKFPKATLVGAGLAAFTFLLTASFLLTAPVWEASLGGFPALNVLPGQFLLKDIVLLSGSIFLAGNALRRIADDA
jgi:uncharacterized membrane protein YkgB